MSDFAFLRSGDGAFLCGKGPFSASEKPPTEGVAFYLNDFQLSDPNPWKVPATSFTAPDPAVLLRDNGASALPEIAWQPVPDEGFAAIYAEIQNDIAAGRLEKSVPVVTECGSVLGGSPAALLKMTRTLPDAFWAYGCRIGGHGMVGATPERLFSLRQDGILETMALAGTAGAGDQNTFAEDDKEIREHEFVADYLVERLSVIGKVERGPRRILDLGSIVHFLSEIRVELADPHPDIDELIRLMHPTPALGAFPRGDGALRKLYRYRSELATPEMFGAPFGVYEDGRFHSVIAIRNLSWDGDRVYLPSGCGVIRGSQLAGEWRELRMKRSMVKALLGV